MNFLNPEYFWLLLFIAAAFIKKEIGFANFRMMGYIVTFVFLVTALARPVIPQAPVKSKELVNDVVLGVDLSYSMQAKDLKPSRLEFVKKELSSLVTKEQRSRFGIIGFTTNAIILSPLTQDSELLLHLFNSLDEGLIVTKGSSILPALELSRKLSSAKKVSVVLFTDGGDQNEFSKEIIFAKEHNMIVNVCMSATNYGGTLQTNAGELLKDETGNIVVTRENKHIKRLSDATGGVYTITLSDIEDALKQQREGSFLQDNTIVQNKELYYYFIALAIISFLISVTTLKRFIIALLLFFGVEMQANMLEIFKNENYLAFINGVHYYESGEYENALSAFSQVRSDNKHIKAIVFYNKANTYIRLKQFSKARVEFLKSLSLEYSKDADENLAHIKNIPDNYEMSTGMQKSKKDAQLAKQRNSSQKSSKKDAGSSNMKVNSSSSGSGDGGKKVQSSQMKIDLHSSKTKLSSKQYELINKRRVNEKTPW